MAKLDKASLLALQLTAPGACKADARKLHARVRHGEVLGGFTGAERDRVWAKLCSATTDCLVPSLFGFFEDYKYIKPAASCMKRLVRLEGKEGIRGALERAFAATDQSDNRCLVQTSCYSFGTVSAAGADPFDIAYRQLWLYALREHHNMAATLNKKLAGPNVTQVDETVLFRFAWLADKLGFRTKQISALLQRDPDREMARRFLQSARKPPEFEFDDIESSITSITDVFATARHLTVDYFVDEYDVKSNAKPPARCGLPHVLDQAQDKRMLYLDKLYRDVETQSSTMSSLFVQRATCFLFLGKGISVPLHDLDVAHVEGATGGSFAADYRVSRAVSRQEQGQSRPELRLETELQAHRTAVAEVEARLRMLEQNEREQLATLEQLQVSIKNHEGRLASFAQDERDIFARTDSLRQKEAEQMLRQQDFDAAEQDLQLPAGDVVHARTDLGEEIRLDLLSSGHHDERVEGEDADTRLQRLLDEVSAAESSIKQLEEAGHEKQLTVERLEREEGRLRELVQELTAQTQQLAVEKQTLVDSVASIELERTSVVDKLVAKELELRQNLDHLETCLERLQTRMADAAEEEKTMLVNTENSTGANDLLPAMGSRQVETDLPPVEESTTSTGHATVVESSMTALENMVREAIGSVAEDEEFQEAAALRNPPGSPLALGGTAATVEGGIPDVTIEGDAAVQAPHPEQVCIKFEQIENGSWILKHEMRVDPADPSEVSRVATKYLRKGIGIFSSRNRVLKPATCFERVTADGTNTIRLVPNWRVEAGNGWEKRRLLPVGHNKGGGS